MTSPSAQGTSEAQLFANAPELWREKLPRLPRDVHKYGRGHCLVVSGPELRTGASRLAAVASLNNGAGAVTIAGGKDALRIHASHVTAIMLEEAATPQEFADLLAERPFDSIVIGPGVGVGEETLARIQAARLSLVPLVLDADGLTSLVGRLDGVSQGGDVSSPCVMTPHAGEFERLFASILLSDPLFASLNSTARNSKVERSRAAARIAKSVIVFKGADTVIAAPDGSAAINSNAGPELATAGSGDVLAGLIGAHLAGGMPAFEAAAAAVWLHGFLGAKIGVGLTADRLVDEVRPLSAFF